MGFFRQEYWHGLPCPSPGDLPKPGIESVSFMSPALAGGFFTTEPPGKPLFSSVQFSSVAQSCLTLCSPMDCSLPGSSVHRDSPGKNAGVCCHTLLQGIFPTQGSNLGLLHCRQILYHLSHRGSPRIPEWIGYPFSRESAQSRNQSGVSCIAGRFFTS